MFRKTVAVWTGLFMVASAMFIVAHLPIEALACTYTKDKPSSVAEQLYEKAHNYGVQGKCIEAIEAYEATLVAEPGHVCAANGLAWTLLTCGSAIKQDAVRALGLAEKVISGEGVTCGGCWDTLAVARSRTGDLNGAHLAHLKSMALTPPGGDEEAVENYIRILERENSFAGGNGTALATAFRKKEGSSDLFEAGKYFNFTMMDAVAAIDFFTVALLIAPDDARVGDFYCHRALAWFRFGDQLFAFLDATTALDKSPANWQALLLRGKLLSNIGRIDEALDHFANAEKNAPNPEVVNMQRGLVLAAIGRHDEALADFDRAIALSPGNATFHFARGLSWKAKGQYRKSVEDMKSALALDPESENARQEIVTLEEHLKSQQSNEITGEHRHGMVE